MKSSKKKTSQSLKSPRLNLGVAVAVVTAVVVLGYVVARSFAASGSAQMYVTPAAATYTNGQSIAVQVYVNTGTDPTNAVEADFSYPTSKLQFVSIDATGSAYDIAASGTGGGGTVAIARGHAGTVTGVALVATVHFNVISTGSAALTFLGTSAVVRSTDNTNILTSTVGGNYTLNAAATPTPTPTPTVTHTPTPVPGVGAKTPTPTPTHASSAKASPSPSKTPVAVGGASTPTPVVTGSTPTPVVTTTNPAATATPFVNKSKSLLTSSKVLGYAAIGVPVLVVLGIIAMTLMRFRGGSALAGAHGADQTFVPPAPQPTAPPPMPSDLTAHNTTFMPGGGTQPPADPNPAPPNNSGPGTPGSV